MSDYCKKWIPLKERGLIEGENRFVQCRNYSSNLEHQLAFLSEDAARKNALKQALDMLANGSITKETAFTLLAAGLGERAFGHRIESSCLGILFHSVSDKLWAVVSAAMKAEIESPLLIVQDGQLGFERHPAAPITDMKSWDEYKATLLRQVSLLSGPSPRNLGKAMQNAINPEKGLLDECEPEREEIDGSNTHEQDEEEEGEFGDQDGEMDEEE